MTSVLVTGGAGYVGAHSCKALSRAGYLPVVVDNLSTGHESFVRWGPLVRADIRDTDAIARALKAHEVSAVLHFAASAYVGESVVDPQKYYENNVVGTLSLLRAMIDAGCKQGRLFKFLRRLRRARRKSHHRRHAAQAREPLRCLEGDGGAYPR